MKADILEELTSARRHDAGKAAKTRDFAAAFVGDGLHVIAELKKASPSEGMIREDFRPRELAQALSGAGAAALSVLAEPHRFLGSEEYVKEAREASDLPILFKDFVSVPHQILAARAAGADAVLLIAAVLDDAQLMELLLAARTLGMEGLVETHDEKEIGRAVGCGAKVVGVNCRNLRNFTTDTSISAGLLRKIPSGIVKIAESGIKTREDMLALREAGANGFLIGTALMKAHDPAAKLKELIG
ncbi:MAG: indole-3-glycerol phosphate synthase TrpC [Kiritimatiellae bacterium]|nr:indole-3-glycerol phosphate synthase TrpC [Kiritimatiellia bacterium]